MHYDYTTVGHVTIDVMPDGSRRAGGGAFYSAVQASRLGLRTRIITQGVEREIAGMLEREGVHADLLIARAEHTTTLQTTGWGAAREQRVLAWAGEMAPCHGEDSEIVHLAPVARELSSPWGADAPFIGLTPQGLARRWDGPGAVIGALAVEGAGARVCDGAAAVVLNERERGSCAGLIARAIGGGSIVAVTAEDGPVSIERAGAAPQPVPVAPLSAAVEDIGAGDVFAAALFIALHEGRDPAAAALFASAAAAVRMGGAGSAAIGDRASIAARLAASAAAQA